MPDATMPDPNDRTPEPDGDFLESASHEQERGLIAEFIGFMAENKMWWMTPILIVLLLVGGLLLLGSSAVMPFLYTLF